MADNQVAPVDQTVPAAPTPDPTAMAGAQVLSAPPDDLSKFTMPQMQSAPTAPAAPAAPPTPPAGPPPGSFGWKLAQTLKGFSQALSGIGDAGAIGEVPPGAGGLYGIEKTMAAQDQRKKAEQAHAEDLAQKARENTREDWKTMANIATANVQMRHEQALTYQLGTEAVDNSIKSGLQMVENLKNAPKSPVQVIQEGLTGDQINALMSKKGPDGKPALDPTTHTAFATGKKFVGEDAQGNPQYATTYSITTVPAQYKLTEEDKPWMDVINKAFPDQKPWTVGSTMPGYAANSLYQQSQNIVANTEARNQAMKNVEFNKEYDSFDSSGTWTKYLSAAGGSPAQAAAMLLRDYNDPQAGAELRQKYTNPMRDIMHQYADKDDPTGAKSWKTMWDDWQDKAQKNDPLFKLETDPSALSGDRASSVIPQLNNMLKQTTDPGRKVRITNLITTAKQAREGYLEDVRSKAAADQAAKDGDPDVAADLLVKGVLTLADLKSRGSTPASIADITSRAVKKDSTYNAADEVEAEKIAGSATANAFFGAANSLIQKGGTLDQLLEVGKQLPQNQLPAFNRAEDWEKAAAGSGPIAGYASTIIGVADDYAKVMGGGTASDSARNYALALMGAALSPSQRQWAIDQLRNTAKSQRDSRAGTNRFLVRRYITPFPTTPVLPVADKGFVSVMIPGQAPMQIPEANLSKFKAKYPEGFVREGQ